MSWEDQGFLGRATFFYCWPRGDQEKLSPPRRGRRDFLASHWINISQKGLKNTVQVFGGFSPTCVSSGINMLRGPRLIFKVPEGTAFNFQGPGGEPCEISGWRGRSPVNPIPLDTPLTNHIVSFQMCSLLYPSVFNSLPPLIRQLQFSMFSVFILYASPEATPCSTCLCLDTGSTSWHQYRSHPVSCLYSILEGGTEQERDLLYDSLGYTQTTLMFGGAPV